MGHVHLPTAAGVGPFVLVKVCHTLILIFFPPFYFFTSRPSVPRPTLERTAPGPSHGPFCATAGPPLPRQRAARPTDRSARSSAAACGPSHGPFCALFRGYVRPVPRTVLRVRGPVLPRPRAARLTDRSARSHIPGPPARCVLSVPRLSGAHGPLCSSVPSEHGGDVSDCSTVTAPGAAH